MPHEALELETRRRLYDHIVENPGKYLRELERDLGMAMGALEYHLDQLVDAGLVHVGHDTHKRFFPTTMDRRDKPLLAFLRQELPRRILLLVLQEGQASRSRLQHALGVAPSTLNYHLRRLVEAGLCSVDREGREAVYRAQDPAAVHRLLVAYRASLLDRMVDAFLAGVDAMR